jgi:hypothetical protein
MKNFLNCSSSKPADPAELKAVLFAVGACVLFIGFLTVAHRAADRSERPVRRIHNYPPPPPAMPVPPLEVPEPPLPSDLNARFRNVPANFRGINFKTRSYGTYEFSNGTSRDLVLIDGKFRDFGDSQNWFDLNDVLYTDLTGDGSPEAIVLMTHLECGQQCDGGKSLLYVYSQNYPLQEIMKYESGSGMDGCSLKAVTVKNKKLTLDLFGKCPQSRGAANDFVIRETYNITRTEFFFNGKQLVPKKTTVLTVPNQHEVTNGVEVRILDDRFPAPHEL